MGSNIIVSNDTLIKGCFCNEINILSSGILDRIVGYLQVGGFQQVNAGKIRAAIIAALHDIIGEPNIIAAQCNAVESCRAKSAFCDVIVVSGYHCAAFQSAGSVIGSILMVCEPNRTVFNTTVICAFHIDSAAIKSDAFYGYVISAFRVDGIRAATADCDGIRRRAVAFGHIQVHFAVGRVIVILSRGVQK